jgi:hypothetical protein
MLGHQMIAAPRQIVKKRPSLTNREAASANRSNRVPLTRRERGHHGRRFDAWFADCQESDDLWSRIRAEACAFFFVSDFPFRLPVLLSTIAHFEPALRTVWGMEAFSTRRLPAITPSPGADSSFSATIRSRGSGNRA